MSFLCKFLSALRLIGSSHGARAFKHKKEETQGCVIKNIQGLIVSTIQRWLKVLPHCCSIEKGKKNLLEWNQLLWGSVCARSARRKHSRDEYTEIYLIGSIDWVREIGKHAITKNSSIHNKSISTQYIHI